MKKFNYIFLLLAAILVSCNGVTGSNTEKETTTTEANASAEVTKTSEVVPEGDDHSEDGKAKPIHLDKETFKAKVMDYEKNPKQWVFEGDKPCVIDFYADWCKPCRMIAPIMEELAVEYEGQIDIYKVDTQVQKELAAVFGVQSLPTVVFVPASGQPSAQKGAMPKESYKQIIDEFLLKKKQ